MRVPGSQPPSGPLADALARPGARPGGIDFSSLELRYVSDGARRAAGSAAPWLAARSRARRIPLPASQRRSAPPTRSSRGSRCRRLVLGQPQAARGGQIIDPQFARTDAGHVMLDADFRLKRILWPLTHPDTPTGAEFWRRIDALYGNDKTKSNMCARSASDRGRPGDRARIGR